MSKIHDECKNRYVELEKELQAFSVSWHDVETRLDSAEDAVLRGRFSAFQRWFALEEADLENWNLGGLRWVCQHRIHDLLVAPLVERLRSRAELAPTSQDEEGNVIQPTARSSNQVLDLLIDYWELRVKVTYEEAQKEDDKLMKKVRKTEKDERAAGVVALGMGDTKKVGALKRQRPAIWENASKELDRFSPALKQLTAFSVEELKEGPMGRLVGAVPAVVVRAVCDWYFTKSVADFDQLEKWWGETKEMLQSKEHMWQALVDKEGLLLRRIEKGLEEVVAKRRRYGVYANFGGSEQEVQHLLSSPDTGEGEPGTLPVKLEEPVKLLATTVSDMHKQLKVIRDSALWRVIDSAQEIHRHLSTSIEAEKPPWQAVLYNEGLAALSKAIREPDMAAGAAEDGGDSADDVLAVMQRLEGLAAGLADLRDHFEKMATPGHTNSWTAIDTAGLCSFLDGIVRDLSGLCEDCLCILDEPEVSAVEEWLTVWEKQLGNANLAQQLDALMEAVQLPKDSTLKPDVRRERAAWLALLKGLQALFEDQALRNQVAKPMLRQAGGWESPTATAAANAAEEQETEAQAVVGLVFTTAAPPPPPPTVDIDFSQLSVPTLPVPQPEPGAGLFFRPPARGRVPWPQQPAQVTAAAQEPAGAPNAETPKASETPKAPNRPETPSTSSTAGDGTPTIAKFLDNTGLVTSKRGSTRLAPLK
mmetsp:Transcript_12228/g.21721  ORF Transcript_12228/g.21721 Transcript_12228/m.21721 type:complete len:703 (-) Transcript_12228:53-2161(-)